MRSKGLGTLLGLCAAFGLSPVVPWALAAIFDGIEDRWLNALGALEFTVPIAFGLAAIVLAAHGILLQAALSDQLAHDFESHPGYAVALASTAALGTPAPTVPVATTAAAPAAGGSQVAVADDGTVVTAEAEEPKRGGKMAVVERPPGFGDPKGKPSKGDKAKRVGRRYSHRAGGAVRRYFRDSFRL